MRRPLASAAVMALLLSACTEVSDRVTEAPQVPAALEIGAEGVVAGECQVTVGSGRGARVSDVLPGSPAEGILEVDDVIVALDGTPIATAADVVERVTTATVGTTITLDVERGGATATVDVTLGDSPEAPDRAQLGVLVVTREDRVAPADLASTIPGGDLSRLISISGSLYGFDPETIGWSRLGVEVPESGWVPVDGEVYWIATDSEGLGGSLIGGLATTIVPVDVDDWTPQVTLSSINGKLLVGADRINDETGAYEAAVLAVDTTTGGYDWAWVAQRDDGTVLFPTFAFKDPDDERVLVVLTEPGDISIATYVLLSEEEDEPAAANPVGLPDNAVIIGWHDPDRLMAVLSTISEAGLTDPDTGETELTTLPLDSVPDGLWPVGDGANLLVDRGGLELLGIDGEARRDLSIGCDDIVMGELGF